MEQLERQLEEMVDSFLNINLYGPSGCGKTSLIKRVLKNKSKIFVKFNLSDFYSKKNIFYLISKSINKYLNSKTNKINNHIENINKWYDLYQTFEDSKDFSFFKIYFIIDSILDIDSFNYYKKELIKLFVTISSYKNMKIILISNFDITNSEIQYDYDFSSFISIQFPVLTNDELKKIIDKECNSSYYEENRYNELVNTCIQNIQYNFSNLNEIIFIIKQNLNSFNYIQNDSKITELLEKAKYKKKIEKKEKGKGKRDNKDEDIEMKNAELDEMDSKNDDNNKSEEEEEEENEVKEKELEKNPENDKDIYTYHAKNDGIQYSHEALRNNIKKQVHYAPIHIIKLETFFKKQQPEIIGLIDEETNKDTIRVKYMDNNKDTENDNNRNNQIKNLTQSLSNSQKMLLLASYIASETSTKNDTNLFKFQKNKKGKKHSKNKNYGLNLKSNIGYPFNVNRLIAIYQYLLNITDQRYEDDDINVKCEIATLAKLGLIRVLSSFDFKAIDQKYFTGINLDLAQKIAEDYGIKLEEYIACEKID
jgi:hypothetical protein